MVGLAKNKNAIELKESGEVSESIGISNCLLGHIIALNNQNRFIVMWKV